MKSRLKKVAMMSPDMFQGQLDQISDEGRNILKSIEEYKFFVEQASRVVKNDPKLTEVIINKKKNLDQAAQQIYDVVFEIENVDVISLYNQQQKAVQENENGDKEPAPAPVPNDAPPQPNQAPTQEAPADQNQQPAQTPLAPQGQEQSQNQQQPAPPQAPKAEEQSNDGGRQDDSKDDSKNKPKDDSKDDKKPKENQDNPKSDDKKAQ